MTFLFMLAASMMLITFAAAQTTYCTSETNISTGQTVDFSLNNVAYHLVQNFITPDTSGITINGTSYTIYPDTPHIINQNTGAYVETTQINYIPIQPSVNFILCSAQQTANTQYNLNLSANEYGDLFFTYFGTKLIIIPSLPVSQQFSNYPTTVTMTNVTSTTPSPPSGYVKLTALILSIASSVSSTINITQNVPCYASPSTIAVYNLVQGSWDLVTGYTYDSGSCTVRAIVPGYNPTVGIFYLSQATTSSTSTSTTTYQTTTVPTTTYPTTSIYTTTKTTSSTSRSTTSSTTLTSTITSTLKSVSSPSTTISIPAQISVPATGVNQIPISIRYAVLGAIALIGVYLIYRWARRTS